jgi:chloramphenicol 3-O-phosphotransferase
MAKVVLFGGPAGAGKSTLARAWCQNRPNAAHVQLDEVRSLIVSGFADPQEAGAAQDEQYEASVAATCALARAFAEEGHDVAVDDVLEPEKFERYWRRHLEGLDWQLVVVLPSLDTTLARASARSKRVLERHTRAQHASSSAWPASVRLDTTHLSLAESLKLVEEVLVERYAAASGGARAAAHLWRYSAVAHGRPQEEDVEVPP